LQAENLIDGAIYTVSFFDSVCTYLEGTLKLQSDTSKQAELDTVIITMPSAPGNCDGSLEFVFSRVPVGALKSFGTDANSNSVSNYTFTNLCEDWYFFNMSLGGQEIIKVPVDMHFDNPTPCYQFDVNVTHNPPSNSSVCNGQLFSNANGGSGSGYYYYFVKQDGGGATIMNSNLSQNFVNGVCEGPYLIDTYNYGNLLWIRNTQYVFAPQQNDSTWNAPDSLLPSTDTILLQAVVNCAPNYSQGIDTAFISSITSLGNSQYEFGITIIQGTDTITAFGNAITDTSLNYFIDITLFCEDSTRSIDPFLGKRNLIYHGIKLQSTTSISENDYFSKMEIFPNPFEDRIKLNYSMKQSAWMKFEISDITGKIIFTQNFYSASGKNQHDLNLPNLNSGMYFLNIFNESKQVYSGKIIRH
jgi:hypothetical protein